MPLVPMGDTKEARALHALCSAPNRAGRRALDKVQGGAPHRGACARWTPRNPKPCAILDTPCIIGESPAALVAAARRERNAEKRERRARRGVS